MQVKKQPIYQFLEGRNKSFVIPVYQRDYAWKQSNLYNIATAKVIRTFTIPYPLSPIPYSLLTIPYSLFPVPCSLFPVPLKP
ncbi:DUF262 domain-containing protein [Anabaenopsis tanganyikae CS-531]|uniref:DUF262 domain-containing protein n=1 Tax=Anabaenopsis tanganyikae CS-531 TaxID=2785304 RepID=A0ABT6KBK4_9CYAN|nr:MULTISPECIES: hypothetical protein [Anabaenopsis]MDH6100636.1 DUF262 domain-containing protein [Anabaenopsis sp. FSS-46]MDH6105128.1 DUF262 domain-containing protein [Anabaenopsis tanganyikae CS-531]